MSQTPTANSPYTAAAEVAPSPMDDCVEARRRAEKTFYQAAQRRIADVDTSTDDVVALAKAIAELKKHDAAMLRANAAMRLADARIESLNAAAEKKKEPNKPFDREAFVKVIRPAIRDIYGLNIDDDTDANNQAATRFSASPTPSDDFCNEPTAAQPPIPPLSASVPSCLGASEKYDIEYQIHSARFAPVAAPHRRHKKKRAPTHRRCPSLLSHLSSPAVDYGAVVKLHTTPTVVPAAFRGSTRQKYVVLFASGNVASVVPG